MPGVARQLGHGDAILRRLPSGPCKVVEVGVGAGELSAYLARHHEGIDLTLVDSWQWRNATDHYRRQCEEVGDPNGVRTPEQVQQDRAAASMVAELYDLTVIPMDSIEAADRVPNRSLDLVFIDADHREAATLADCRAWVSKVKPGGWIGGHDYARFSDHGVLNAVAVFALQEDLTVETDQDWTWFCRLPGGEA